MARFMLCDLGIDYIFDLPLTTAPDTSSSQDVISLDTDDDCAHDENILCGVKPEAVAWKVLIVKMNDHGV